MFAWIFMFMGPAKHERVVIFRSFVRQLIISIFRFLFIWQGADRYSVELYMVVHRDHQAAAAIDHLGLNQVCPLRVHSDDDVRGFDFKFSGAGHI